MDPGLRRDDEHTAMKGLLTLIKLSKRTLDELRRKLTALETAKAQKEQAIIQLRQEVEREMHMASQRPEMGNFFGGFAKRMRLREQELHAEILKTDKEIDAMREEIAKAFAEQKKYEIALENAKLREKEKLARLETIAMDEIASQQHNRKQEEN
ncbi:MAG: hypothetical protein K2Q01_01965 [Rickettsiales bacterium]|nr:hypothetical protein [Rickettsiales bacterium]